MTQIGKCDICRQRKIKCDEIHPVCGGCRKKNRPCHYSYGKVSQYIEEGGIMMDGGKPLTIRRAQEGPARTKKPAADVTSKPASLEATENSASSLLRLRSSRQTQDGNGLFQTFAPLCKKADRPANAMTKVRSYIQSNGSHMPVQDDYNRVDPIMLLFMEPSNEATQRLDHWVHFTETLKDLYGIRWILGEWMELVPCRLGNAKSLDAAVDCFEKAVAYRNNKSTQNLALTASSNGTALRSIRTDILSGQHDLIANDVLLAICLLIFAEIFIRPGSGEYKYHQTGLLNLIMNISKNGAQCNDSIRYFIDCCCSWEAFPAISQNRDSLFDDPVWVNIEKPPLTAPGQPETEGSFDRMIHCMRMHWSTLPRLTRLVKAAAIMPEDMALRTEAAELAFELWSLDLDEVVQEFFDLGKITIAPTLTEECQPYLDHCLNFATYPVHVGLLNYWTVRTLLCGLILHLLDLFPVVPSSFLFDYDEVAAHDVQCARYLAMSIQYSCLERGPVPLDSIRHMAPMQVAFCSFDRLETRSGGRGSSTPEAEYSRRMKDLVMTVLKDRVSRLDLSQFSVASLENRHRQWTGRIQQYPIWQTCA